MIVRAGFALFLFAALTPNATAAELTEQQQMGQRLMTQSCAVCHLKPQINAQTYGPPLSRESAGGNEEVMREIIMNGTPRMPGFKLLFEPAQIGAIIAYLKTVPPAAPR